MIPAEFDLARLTSPELQERIAGKSPVVVMVPTGSMEPHGPHLPLATDTIISLAACVRACRQLANDNVPLVTTPVTYGVTECASAFAGALSVPAEVLTSFLRAIVASLLDDGVAHVCLVNNHLEPEHDAAVRAAAEGFGEGCVSVACPLTRRWGRTLSDEFKSGACHAGRYETSIVLAAEPELVDIERARTLPDNPVSLSEKLRDGVNDFVEMGLDQAYAGSPARADTDHGDAQLELLGTMIATEIREALAAR